MMESPVGVIQTMFWLPLLYYRNASSVKLLKILFGSHDRYLGIKESVFQGRGCFRSNKRSEIGVNCYEIDTIKVWEEK